MKKLFSLVFLCALILSIAQAQTTQNIGFISGKVTARLTGQPIAGATVGVAGKTETVTDEDGNYKLEISPRTYNLRVNAKGFAPVIINEISITGQRTLVKDVRLDVTVSEEVEVRSETFPVSDEQTTSSTSLNRNEIRATPGTAGDPLRAINSLPQVTIASSEFADLIVRGGSTGENLTYIDNIPVGDFTLYTDQYDNGRGGRAAILAPDVIDRVDFSAGGFGARYGERMSSALDIRLREANRKRFQGTVFADSGTAGATLETPLGKRGSWLFSFRRSYVDVAFDIAKIGDIGRPRNFDFINKFSFDLSPRHHLTFTALNIFEKFTFDRDEAANIDRRVDRLETVRRSRKLILGATLSSALGSKTLSNLTLWASGQHADGTFLRPDFFRTLQRSRDLRDSEAGVKEELTSELSKEVQIAAGGGLVFDRANYFTFEQSGLFYSPLFEEYFSPARSNRFNPGTVTSAYAYFQTTWKPNPRFAVTPGVRVDRFGLTDQTLASPRLSARFGVNSRVALTFAAGIYRQLPGLFTMSLLPENRSLKAQRAVHFIGGVEWLAREDVRVRVEGYEKNYDELVVQPVLGSRQFFNTGEGFARGLEISVQKSLSGRFAGQAAYSFVRSRRRYNAGGFEFPSDYERPHQLTLIGITRFFGFTLAGKLRVASGLPYSVRTPTFVFPVDFLHRVARVEDTNAGRLPTFASFDLRVERRFNLKRWSFAPYVDFFNLTSRDNITELNYEFFSPTPFRLREGNTLPIFGLRIEF